MVFAFVLQWGFGVFWGLKWVGFCWLVFWQLCKSLYALYAIVRLAKAGVECVLVGWLTIRLLRGIGVFLCGQRFLRLMNNAEESCSGFEVGWFC